MNTAFKAKRIKSGIALRGGAPTRQPGYTNSTAVYRANEATPAVVIIQGEERK